MDIQAAVSTILTTDYTEVELSTNLKVVREIFDDSNASHLPVLESGKLKGLVSKSDFTFFLHGQKHSRPHFFVDDETLEASTVQQIMTTNVPKLAPDASIQEALTIFEKKHLLCIAIMQKNKLMGLLTPVEIMKVLE